MSRRLLLVFLAWLSVFPLAMRAQEFKLFGQSTQVHGFASQGFVHTDNNNWLTMNTAGVGSGEFTDFGINVSMQVGDRFRIGAQGYDRKLGQLGDWHPSLDWAVADYRFKSWFGVRGGKVKTRLGLYNDTQDLDFLHTFALLPQSLYPTDLRDTSIAHLGGDIYGNFLLRQRLGNISYTAYAGHRSDSIYSGYPYLLAALGPHLKSLGGLQYGADLRWNTPLKGLLAGVSRINEDITGKGTVISKVNPQAGIVPYVETSKADWTNQFYGEYAVGKWRFDSEYRRYLRNQIVLNGTSVNITDVRGWYVSGSYRIIRRLQVGSYYSRYTVTSVFGGPLAAFRTNQTDTSLPANHIYDKVITARVDLNKFWNVIVEGHFMNGYGESSYPDGFYPQVNPMGLKTDTNALVIKTALNF